MKFHLKVLVTCWLALVWSASVSSTFASATGHFTSSVEHTSLQGADVTTSKVEVTVKGEGWRCNEATYTGTTTSVTVTEITLTPTFHKCEHDIGSVHVAMNNCDYLLTIDKKASSDNPVHLVCPGGKGPEAAVTGPFGTCTITITPNQTPVGGVAYTTGVNGGKHDITLDVTLSNIHMELHGGVFLCGTGTTTHLGSMHGSVTMEGRDTSNNPVDIEATGSEDPPNEFHSEVDHTLVTGSQSTTNSFSFGLLLGSFKCEVSTFDGTASAKTVAELTIKPAYSKCTGVEREVTIHMNGCAYVLTVTGAGTDGFVHIECPSGKAIEMTVDAFPEGCTVTVGAQMAGGVVDYKAEGSGATRDLLLTWTLEGIDYERDGCEVGGKGNNGTYTGSVTLKAENTSGEQKGIWVE